MCCCVGFSMCSSSKRRAVDLAIVNPVHRTFHEHVIPNTKRILAHNVRYHSSRHPTSPRLCHLFWASTRTHVLLPLNVSHRTLLQYGSVCVVDDMLAMIIAPIRIRCIGGDGGQAITKRTLLSARYYVGYSTTLPGIRFPIIWPILYRRDGHAISRIQRLVLGAPSSIEDIIHTNLQPCLRLDSEHAETPRVHPQAHQLGAVDPIHRTRCFLQNGLSIININTN